MTSLLDDCSESEFLVSESAFILFVTNVPRKPGDATLKARLTIIFSYQVDKNNVGWKLIGHLNMWEVFQKAKMWILLCQVTHFCPSSWPCCSDYLLYILHGYQLGISFSDTKPCSSFVPSYRKSELSCCLYCSIQGLMYPNLATGHKRMTLTLQRLRKKSWTYLVRSIRHSAFLSLKLMVRYYLFCFLKMSSII